jgi:hypothetical protein
MLAPRRPPLRNELSIRSGRVLVTALICSADQPRRFYSHVAEGLHGEAASRVANIIFGSVSSA